MSDLPSRDAFKNLEQAMVDGWLPPGWRTVLREFGSGRLRTEAEWREGIDYLAFETQLHHLMSESVTGLTPSEWAQRIGHAAIGVSDDD